MNHKFLVVISGDFSRNEAQQLLREIGSHQGSLPPDERLSFSCQVYPVQQRPTLLMEKK